MKHDTLATLNPWVFAQLILSLPTDASLHVYRLRQGEYRCIPCLYGLCDEFGCDGRSWTRHDLMIAAHDSTQTRKDIPRKPARCYCAKVHRRMNSTAELPQMVAPDAGERVAATLAAQ